MAENASTEKDSTGDSLTAVTSLGEVETGKEMPPVEPGHKGHSLNSGEIYDPNAARRHKEGRPPGLQDSEIKDPAHWQQPLDPGEVTDREIEYLEQQIDRLKKLRADEKRAASSTTGVRVGSADAEKSK